MIFIRYSLKHFGHIAAGHEYPALLPLRSPEYLSHFLSFPCAIADCDSDREGGGGCTPSLPQDGDQPAGETRGGCGAKHTATLH